MTFNFLGPGLTVNVEAKVKEQIILDSSGSEHNNLPRERFLNVRKKVNRGVAMCFLVAVYMISSIVFLLQTNPYTQDIYDFPSLVSSQTRIMKSRLYDFRSLTLYFFIDGSQLSPTGKRPGDA